MKTRKEYLDMLETALKEAVEYANNDVDAVGTYDIIHELCDNAVIYTRACLEILCSSDFDDNAIFDDLGDDALVGVTGASDVYQRMAYYALSAFMFEHVDEIMNQIREEIEETEEI